MLQLWKHYLVENGLDPANQLRTADMLGHVAHNADLSLKSIIGMGAYSILCRMEGKANEAENALATARS